MKKAIIFLVLFSFFNHLNLWAEKTEKNTTNVENNNLNSKKEHEEIIWAEKTEKDATIVEKNDPDSKKRYEEIKGSQDFIGYKLSKLIHTGKEIILNHYLLKKIFEDHYKKDKELINKYNLIFLDYNYQYEKTSALREVLEYFNIDYKKLILYFFSSVGNDWGNEDPRIKIIWESYLGKFTPIAIEYVSLHQE